MENCDQYSVNKQTLGRIWKILNRKFPEKQIANNFNLYIRPPTFRGFPGGYKFVCWERYHWMNETECVFKFNL